MKKIEFVKSRRTKDGLEMTYKYRDHFYTVTRYNNGYTDPLKWQHERERCKIDRIIDLNVSTKTPVEEDLKEFFKEIEV